MTTLEELPPSARRKPPPPRSASGIAHGCVHAENAFGPPPRSPRYESLDAWRGIACLAIVVYHASLYYQAQEWGRGIDAEKTKTLAGHLLDAIHYLSLGVPVFFVISGYCISATADSGRRRGQSIGNYFRRRFRRIFLPFWALVLLTIPLIFLVEQALAPGLLSGSPRSQLAPWELGVSQWIGNLTLTETWRHHLVGLPRAQFVGQSWTLCYEEQFYAVAGLLLLLSSKRFFLLAALLTLFCLILHAVLVKLEVDDRGFFFDGNWTMFAVGILLYYQINYAEHWQRSACYIVLLATLLAGTVFPVILPSGNVAAGGFAILMALLHRWDTQVSKAVWMRPIRFCGTMCYSLYLVHALLVCIITKQLYIWGISSAEETILVTIPVCIVVSLAGAFLFHYTIERRFLNSPRASTPVRQPLEVGDR